MTSTCTGNRHRHWHWHQWPAPTARDVLVCSFFPWQKFCNQLENRLSTDENLKLCVKKSFNLPVENNFFPWKITANYKTVKTNLSAWKIYKIQPMKTTKAPLKLLISCCWKFIFYSSQIIKSLRESFGVPVKFWEIAPIKNILHPWKNQKKEQKSVSRVTLVFKEKRKNWCWWRNQIIEEP